MGLTFIVHADLFIIEQSLGIKKGKKGQKKKKKKEEKILTIAFMSLRTISFIHLFSTESSI